MRRSPNANATVILMAVFVALFVSMLDWFFVISPRLSGAAEAREATALQLDQNELLQTVLNQRIEDSKNLPALREQVWEVRDQFPSEVSADTIREDLEATASRHGFVMMGDTLGPPLPVQPGVILTPALAPYGMDPYADALVFTALDGAPIGINLQGRYDRVLGLLDDLQVGDHRYFLITSLQVTAMAENASATPPVGPESVEMALSGYFFVLDHGVAGVSARPESEPFPGDEPLPSEVDFTPANDRNFFVPTS